jgi:hypothetical protein
LFNFQKPYQFSRQSPLASSDQLGQLDEKRPSR